MQGTSGNARAFPGNARACPGNARAYPGMHVHFVEKQLDDNFSEQVFDSFIDGLDPSKRYFTQEDIKLFSKYKYRIDNQLKESDLSFYNAVYAVFLEKIKSAKDFYGEILKEPFNYRKQETINVDFEQVPFAKNQNELIDYWRKQLKLQTIDKIQELESLEKNKAEKDSKYKKRTTSKIKLNFIK